MKNYLEVVVVAVEGLGHVGGDVGVAAGEEHVDHVRGEGRHLHTRGARVARGRGWPPADLSVGPVHEDDLMGGEVMGAEEDVAIPQVPNNSR